MIDHIGIEVSNYEQAKYFYQQVLAPLGYELLDLFQNSTYNGNCIVVPVLESSCIPYTLRFCAP